MGRISMVWWNAGIRAMVILYVTHVSASASSYEVLSAAEEAQYHLLRGLQWQKQLSGTDKTNVISALESQKDKIAAMALTVAVVQGELDALRERKGRVGSDGSLARKVGIEIARILRAGQEPTTELHQSIAKWRKGGKKLPGPVGRRIASIAQHILVVAEVRALRSGARKTPGVSGLDLTHGERMLIEYGRKPPQEAEALVLRKLRRAKVASARNLELIGVLADYEEPLIEAVVTRLTEGTDVTNAEAVVLLRYLSAEAHRLNREAAGELYKTISGLTFPRQGATSQRKRLLDLLSSRL